ncbi:hypothetical protein LTR50_003954 [Elasticomyces elasticus]|nr:hypothetical protein LTR50_003954 [Elasticomyces elasticus]
MASTRSQSKPLPSTPTSTSSSSPTPAWSHTPSNLTLIWLAISLPLVAWDTGYVFLRPYSMPGGSLHYPIWQPYALYGTIDYTYGWPAWNAHSGFTAAQGFMNFVESAGYVVYLWIVFVYGVQERRKGRGAPKKGDMGSFAWLSESRTVYGRLAAWAVLLGFATAVMTASKTVLYWLNEYFSGFENIGHNGLEALVVLWIIPNGVWIIFPSYMIYVFGQEILQGLEAASNGTEKSK